MRNTRMCGILITAQDGFIECPSCGKKIQRITRETTAEHLPLWCPRCRREIMIEIQRDRSA